jgi:hypothetical protein
MPLRADAPTDVASPIDIGAGKFALTASQTKKLLAMDRYEACARLRLKSAIQAYSISAIPLGAEPAPTGRPRRGRDRHSGGKWHAPDASFLRAPNLRQTKVQIHGGQPALRWNTRSRASLRCANPLDLRGRGRNPGSRDRAALLDGRN